MSQKAEFVALERRLIRLEQMHRSQVRGLQKTVAEREADLTRLRDALIAKRVITEDDVRVNGR